MTTPLTGSPGLLAIQLNQKDNLDGVLSLTPEYENNPDEIETL